jgi:hypothetical protein
VATPAGDEHDPALKGARRHANDLQCKRQRSGAMIRDLPGVWLIYLLAVSVLTVGIFVLAAINVGPEVWRGAQQTFADWRAGRARWRP